MPDPVSQTSFEVVLLDDTALVQIPVRLAGNEAVTFKETCQQLLQNGSIPQKIIFDFSKTTFIDSSGIGALVSNHKLARLKEVPLVLRGVLPQVMAVLQMTALDKVLAFERRDDFIKPLGGCEEKEPENPWQPEAKSSFWGLFTKEPKVELPTTHPSVRSWVKRALDIVGALVGLGITAVVFIPIAIAIKLDNPGPIFFGQIRKGWMGREFRIWKFRSMKVNADEIKAQLEKDNESDGKTFKIKNDPRVTRVGGFLRKTSLDELPQFWNVLKGEMSLVGTRPPTPNEVDIYEVPEWQRLDVKPGMTGEWQVHGRSSIRNFEDIIKLDLRYQQNWSLAYDLKLIFKTILVVLRKDSGAV
ncbi:MAG TPA: anti-anti-sigma factor [Cyanobacteria bacterium UBA8553]|nr:anti-anti-sigma factor [Cyanobacteria bacterium UBA8553]